MAIKQEYKAQEAKVNGKFAFTALFTCLFTAKYLIIL